MPPKKKQQKKPTKKPAKKSKPQNQGNLQRNHYIIMNDTNELQETRSHKSFH